MNTCGNRSVERKRKKKIMTLREYHRSDHENMWSVEENSGNVKSNHNWNNR